MELKATSSRAVLGIAFGEIVPNDNHRNTPRKADHDQADHIFGVAP